MTSAYSCQSYSTRTVRSSHPILLRPSAPSALPQPKSCLLPLLKLLIGYLRSDGNIEGELHERRSCRECKVEPRYDQDEEESRRSGYRAYTLDILAMAHTDILNRPIPLIEITLRFTSTSSPDVSLYPNISYLGSALTIGCSDVNGRAQPSERNVLSHINELEKIGFRSVGTPQAIRGEEYIIDQVRLHESRCMAGGVLNCEVWVQKGSGYHA